VAYRPEQPELSAAGYPEWMWDQVEELYRHQGCPACSNTGFRGRIGLYEVMQMSEEIERLTVERSSAEAIRTVAVQQGMITLRDDGLQKALMGITSLDEVARVVK
jgi:type IV pilus assembly protein PilB